ncbi:SDR family oxidoreductase [Aestuariivirga sp. YIM B02566]|uniref:SDR family oxidoreductase n=1 Tax=Taklimakanibacter albus TaxID=2800327 RepID=A0ACC5R3G5_9HYPH|nr:SDR family oxidoreductase [Aestuariivirga sp. YIM B02566]MBK1867021.1 SDR family oxidoreductase [Aestuariivirga sp. YIM B02566]
MRILVLGAGGFIGRHIVAELLKGGHQPVGAVRRAADFARAFPGAAAVACDLARDVAVADWLPRLAGVDAVVNAAGVLSGAGMEAVHVTAPRALYEACAQADVKRVVLISAISARPEVDTDYARAKLAGEKLLQDGPLDWTILKPSLIVAKGSYGGTSLIRGLAGLPLFTPLVGDSHFAFSPLHAQDLARAVRVVCEEGRFSRQVLEPAGPEIISLRDLLSRYRTWLGLPPAPYLSIPMGVMRGLAGLGDRMGRGPVSSNSLAQLIAGNEGDGERFAREIGFTPRSLAQFMAEEPAEVQDRWHARLFFMAPVLKFALALMWLLSGLIGFFTGLPLAQKVLAALGLPSGLAMPVVVLTCLIDLAICFLVLSGRKATVAQLIVIAGYTLALTFALPVLWLDPLGPLLKNIPIVAAVLCHGVLREQR